MSILIGDHTDNAIDGTDNGDVIVARKGNDTINAGAGDDWVFAGKGDDVIDAGAGSDVVFAGKGDDTVIHSESDNLGSENWYFGGRGEDTLRLVVSQATLDSPDFQQELAAFQAMIDAGRPATGYFTSLNIHFSSFEAIEVVLDNEPPTSISLSNASVVENAAGAEIGTLSAIDPNGDAGLTFSLMGDSQSYYEIVDGTTLKLRDDISLNYEEGPVLPPAVVQVTDPGGLTYTQEFDIEVEDVNEAPTVALENVSTGLAEDADTTAPIKVADIVVDDDALGSYVLTLSGDDAGLFEIVGTELYLKAGPALDFETNPSLDVTVAVDDTTVGTTPDATAALSIAIADVNEAPVLTSVPSAALQENLPGGTIASIMIDDPDVDDGIASFDVSDDRFDFVGGNLVLKANETLDYETDNGQSVTLSVTDNGGATGSIDIPLLVTDVNEAPTAITPSDFANFHTYYGSGTTIGSLTVVDPDGDSVFDFYVSDSRLEIIDGILKVKVGESIDLGTAPAVAFDVTATDPGGLSYTQQVAILVLFSDFPEDFIL